MAKGKESNLKEEIAKDIHNIFLESMEARYKEILSFLGFLLPALSAFLWLSYNFEIKQPQQTNNNNIVSVQSDTTNKNLHDRLDAVLINIEKSDSLENDKNNSTIQSNPKKQKTTNQSKAFLIGTIAVIGVLAWGAIYALAISYRYRYLQASVYLIEERTGASQYIPRSFKPKPINTLKSSFGLSIAPSILQINIFFFIFFILVINFAFIVITKNINDFLILLIFTALCITGIFLMGSIQYPKKLNKIIEDLGSREKDNKD